MPTPCDDLATKAELQELRDQLNEALGTREDGGKVTLFAKGASNPVVQAGVGLTLLGMAKTVAPKAVTDILLEGAATGVTWQKMASMNTGIRAKFGNGTTGSMSGMDAVANTAGGAAGAASAGGKVAATSAGAVMLLASLVQIAGTLALNKATVDIFDARIEAEASGSRQALDQVNNNMLRLYERNNEDIEAVNQDIANQNALIANAQQQILITKSDISQLNNQTSDLYSKLEDANQTIYQLQVDNQQAAQQINELETELTETKLEFINALNTVETQLNAALETIEQMKIDAQAQAERIALLEAKTVELEARMTQYEIDNANLKANVEDLRDDLDILTQETEEEAQLREIKSKLTSAKLIIERYRAAQARRSGSGGFATGQAAVAQTGILELTNKLGDPDLNTTPIPTTVTREDVIDNPQSFKERFAALLDRINPQAVTPEQLAELQTGIRTGVGTDLTAIFGSMIVPRLDNIADATSERKIAQGVQTGICNSLNGGSCPATPTIPNPTQGLQGMNNNLANWLGAGQLLQGQNITNIVKDTNSAVRHSKYGLEAVQGFADKAWKATQADKVLAVVNTTLLIHNAMMLSNNLFQTIGEATSVALQAIGIKDHEDNAIDVNTLVKNKLDAMLTNVLGAENYKALTARIAKANRIYQSSINLLDTTRNMFDSAQSIAEIGTRYTGEIGNALRDAGVVAEDAYEEMVEKISPQSAKIMGFQKFVDGIEVVENAFDSVSQISSNVVEIQENVTQLKTEKQALKTELDTKIQTKKDERVEVKTDSQITADPEDADFDAASLES